MLVTIGVDTLGERPVLGVSVSPSEAEARWRDILASLRARGRLGVKPAVSDVHAGLKEALAVRLTGVPWQRCQFRLAKNVLACVPRPSMRPEVTASLRAFFDAPDRSEAERRLDLAVKESWTKATKLAECLEANVREGPTVFALPLGTGGGCGPAPC